MSFKVGDKVGVVRHAEARKGKDAEWNLAEMLSCPTGAIGTITNVDDDGSVTFENSSGRAHGVNPESFELVKEENMNEQEAIQYLQSLGYVIQAPTPQQGEIWLVDSTYQAMYVQYDCEQFQWIYVKNGNRISDRPETVTPNKRIAKNLKEAIEKGLLNL